MRGTRGTHIFAVVPKRVLLLYDGSVPKQGSRTPMTISPKVKAILTDAHFLVPLVVFFVGLALLITLH
jgi:hypothetical protein